MKIRTATEVHNDHHWKMVEARPDYHAGLTRLVNDGTHHIAWTSDLSQSIPIKPTGEHNLRPGLVLHTAKLPVTPSTDATLIHEIAKLEGRGIELLILPCQIYEELFSAKGISKGEITFRSVNILSRLLHAAESYIPISLHPYVEILGLVGKAGGDYCEAIRRMNVVNQSSAIQGRDSS